MQVDLAPTEAVSAPELDLEKVAVDSLSNVRAYRRASGGPPLFVVAEAGRFTTISEAVDWARAHRPALDQLILEYGGIVLRDFPIRTSEDFNQFINVFPMYSRGYVGGGSPRKKITGKVMEATQLSGTMTITLHSEMGYQRTYPPRIAFFCQKPADVGGETIIGSARELTKRIPAALREKLERLGVRSIRNFAPAGSSREMAVTDHPDKRGWDEVFDTDSKEEVERACADMGMTPIWNEDGTLTLVSELEPLERHPRTGEPLYRTQTHTNRTFERGDLKAVTQQLRASQKMPSGHSFRNGEPMSDEEADAIDRIYRDITIAWPWQSGDVMILDNLQVHHGRNPYSGSRNVQVALLDW